MSAINEFKKLLAEAAESQKKIDEHLQEEESIVNKTARYLQTKNDDAPAQPKDIESQRWNDPLRPVDQEFVTFKQMNDHYGLLLQRIQQQMSTISGGGEVNLRNLDDVDSSTIGPNRHLAYNPTTRKFFFENVSQSEPQVQSDWNEVDSENVAFINNKPTALSDFSNDVGFITSADGGNADQLDGEEGSYYLEYSNFTNTPVELADDDQTTSIANNTISVTNLPNGEIGPIQSLSFDITHDITQHDHSAGEICWNEDDQTLNVFHIGGVVQQVGQELYGYVRNNTGSTITDGTAVRFAGAEENGTSRLEVAPFEADGTFPSLYSLGIATQDIEDGEDGRVTVWGKVRGIDTTGGVENWQIGDILYASSTIPGGLTNIKPTAPNNVVPMAAVLKSDATEGEIFVRPTIEQTMSYGKFELTSNLEITSVNTANVIEFDTIEISNGVDRVVGNNSRLQVNQSGLYQIDVSAQIDVAGGFFNSGTMYMWIRKNGVDVDDSTRRQGVINAAPSNTLTFAVVLSLNVNDYVEIAYAGDNGELLFSASDSTSFAPSTAAVKLGITQIQL